MRTHQAVGTGDATTTSAAAVRTVISSRKKNSLTVCTRQIAPVLSCEISMADSAARFAAKRSPPDDDESEVPPDPTLTTGAAPPVENRRRTRTALTTPTNVWPVAPGAVKISAVEKLTPSFATSTKI